MLITKLHQLKSVENVGLGQIETPTCLLASAGPFWRAQADKVLKAFTTWAPGISLDSKQQTLPSCLASSWVLTTWTWRQLITHLFNFYSPLQILSIGLWVLVLLEIVAHVNHHLSISENQWIWFKEEKITNWDVLMNHLAVQHGTFSLSWGARDSRKS